MLLDAMMQEDEERLTVTMQMLKEKVHDRETWRH